MTEAIPRWKVFPREIESGLEIYCNRDIGDWHTGKMSSRKLLTLLDGLPNDSWYKLSLAQFIEECKAELERAHSRDVSALIRAQLTGQEVTRG